jgi:hypothetical protein
LEAALVSCPAHVRGLEENDVRLVQAVARGELRTRILMLCPFGAGVGSEEYAAVGDVPLYWPCSCGAEHSFDAHDAEVQFALVSCPAGASPTEAERTVKSLATMLGWENVPPRETLEREINELKHRAAALVSCPAVSQEPCGSGYFPCTLLKGHAGVCNSHGTLPSPPLPAAEKEEG